MELKKWLSLIIDNMIKNKFIHESAYVSDLAHIGEDCKIWHFSHIRENAQIGKKVSLGQNVYIDKNVIIGNNCKIQNNVSIYNGVVIEDNVFIGPSVTFTNDLYPKVDDWEMSRIKKTLIKKGSSIGANVTVVCGIEIGENVLIGAGSVVTKSIPDNSLAYGNPAKVMKKYK